MTVYDLPIVNASLNATATVLLLIARNQIKQRKIENHKKIMIAAFCVSIVFLICYLVYHFGAVLHAEFNGPSWLRPVYYVLLLSHVLLAMTVPVFATISLRRGLRRDDQRHKKIVKYAYPIWLYVSVTGVVIYLLLYQVFPQHI
jgi:putative membrane protein